MLSGPRRFQCESNIKIPHRLNFLLVFGFAFALVVFTRILCTDRQLGFLSLLPQVVTSQPGKLAHDSHFLQGARNERALGQTSIETNCGSGGEEESIARQR